MDASNQSEYEYFPNPLGTDAGEWFAYAGRLDRNGREQEARRAYEITGALGLAQLPEADRPRFYLQYGSTLRNLKEFSLADGVLAEGCRHYPDHAALKLFKAFNDCSMGRHEEAAKILMRLVAALGQDPSLTEYRQSIHSYVEEICREPASASSPALDLP